jgi:hypothetical protein
LIRHQTNQIRHNNRHNQIGKDQWAYRDEGAAIDGSNAKHAPILASVASINANTPRAY